MRGRFLREERVHNGVREKRKREKEEEEKKGWKVKRIKNLNLSELLFLWALGSLVNSLVAIIHRQISGQHLLYGCQKKKYVPNDL